MTFLKNKYRTHSCGILRKENIGETVTLSGWIDSLRNFGNLVFVDLRDDSGITQLVFKDELVSKITNIRVESTLCATGKVISRGDLVNKERATGEIEVEVSDFYVIAESDVLPFTISKEDNSPEAVRLEYRYLELRRQKAREMIKLRSHVIKRMRDLMWELGFMEFNTPILTSSSPEGARDFLVPSRLHPGQFFALPQAPQIFKELIMVSGFDNYFQIAPCFRDEDPRADRSPGEFYQLDLEMSFPEQDDLLKVGETVMHDIFTKFSSWNVSPTPFRRISFNDALRDYGSDKPDLRIENKLKNITSIFENSNFEIFKNKVKEGEEVIALKFDIPSLPSRKQLDEYCAFFEKTSKDLRLSYLLIDEENTKGNIFKSLTSEEIDKIKEICEVSQGGAKIIFISIGKKRKVLTNMGKLRVKFAKDYDLIKKNTYEFCWIVDFPMYEEDEETGKLDFCHNPFSMPHGGIADFDKENPLDIMAYQYDLVLNGYELCSGAIRNHSVEGLIKAFEKVGYTEEHVREKFSSMCNAFRFGPPPHGGMAFGIERIIMLLVDVEVIRDVILFPLAQTVQDLMMHAPSEPTPEQLKELSLEIKIDKKA